MAPDRREREHRAEAERLALLPADVRQQFLAAFRLASADPELSAEDRQAAAERVEALERFLQE
jgi:hypothetical protein